MPSILFSGKKNNNNNNTNYYLICQNNEISLFKAIIITLLIKENICISCKVNFIYKFLNDFGYYAHQQCSTRQQRLQKNNPLVITNKCAPRGPTNICVKKTKLGGS